MKIGSLFSGIGGLELGLEVAGCGRVVFQVEQDPFCLAILARHWPDVRRCTDVRTVDARVLGPCDILIGGFPCQDVSSAGKRAGLSGARSGLWREFLRIARDLRPRAVVVENVTSGERAWLPFVRHDLLLLGYVTEAWRVGASDVGAPHRRLRTFVIGTLGNAHPEGQSQPGRALPNERRRTGNTGGGMGNARRERQQVRGLWSGQAGGRDAQDASGSPVACEQRPLVRLGGGADGLPPRVDLPARWPAARGQEQEAWEPSRTCAPRSISHNAARLRALGNAVVPQVAAVIGRRLLDLLGGTA